MSYLSCIMLRYQNGFGNGIIIFYCYYFCGLTRCQIQCLFHFCWSVFCDLWGRPADEGGDLCGTWRWTSARPCLQRTGTTSFCQGLPQACLLHIYNLARDRIWTGEWGKHSSLGYKEHFLLVFSLHITTLLSLQCSTSCGGGVRERRVSCFDTNLNPYPEARCGLASRPVSVEACNSQPCPGAQSESNLNLLHTLLVWLFVFFVINQCTFLAVPSVQDPRAHETTIRGFVPHVPEEPSGM